MSLCTTGSLQLEMCRLATYFDLRDRFLCNWYCRCLAKNGMVVKCLDQYYKFVAKNNGLLYLIDNQDIQILIDLIFCDFKESLVEGDLTL